jgi:uncharacterized protein (DUF1786 family)
MDVDALGVAAFDHGAAPPGYSDRAFRFDYLATTIGVTGRLDALAYPREGLPADLTRLQAIAACVPTGLPLVLMDTGAAAALGALEDRRVRRARAPLLVNVGNFHTLAFQMAPREGDLAADGSHVVRGLFEHHTGELRPGQLDHLLDRLAAGALTNEEVFDTQGHGALVRERAAVTPDLCAVTGPRRALMAASPWQPYYAVPHGDMMLAGDFGLLRAMARLEPAWREEIEASLGEGS